MSDDHVIRKMMKDEGYYPLSREKGFSPDEIQAVRNGRAQYPGRPFPPLIFGFEYLQESRLPQWVYKESLPSAVVTLKFKQKDGSVTAKDVVIYKVPTSPPDSVIREHKRRAEAAAARIEYVDVNSRKADSVQHWSDVDRAGDDR